MAVEWSGVVDSAKKLPKSCKEIVAFSQVQVGWSASTLPLPHPSPKQKIIIRLLQVSYYKLNS